MNIHEQLWNAHRSSIVTAHRASSDPDAVALIVSGEITGDGRDVAEVVPRADLPRRLECIREDVRLGLSAAELFRGVDSASNDATSRQLVIVGRTGADLEHLIDWTSPALAYGSNTDG